MLTPLALISWLTSTIGTQRKSLGSIFGVELRTNREACLADEGEAAIRRTARARRGLATPCKEQIVQGEQVIPITVAPVAEEVVTNGLVAATRNLPEKTLVPPPTEIVPGCGARS